MKSQSDQPFRHRFAPPVERTYFRDLDNAAVETLVEKFSGKVPEERIARMRELPTRFDTPERFRDAYREVTGHMPGDNVLGFSTGLEAPAHVRTDDLNSVPETVFHERTHQMADPSSDRLLGRERNEGVTEHIAWGAADLDPEYWPQRGYIQETSDAARLEKALGSNAIEETYFRGDSALLAERIEDRLKATPEYEQPDK